jgi:hypothetical protein
MSALRRKRYFSSLFFIIFGIFLTRVPEAHAIAGGRDANTLKGQVQIFKTVGVNQIYVCTGSLIAPTWVLTAKHCIVNNNLTVINTDILAGSLGLDQGDVHVLANIYQNPTFDAALLQLTTPLPEDVLPVIPYGTGIPPINSSTNPGGSILVQGWGATGDGTLPNVLQTSTQEVTADNAGQLYIGPKDPIPGVLQGGDSGAGYIFYGTVCGVQSQGIPPISRGPATDSIAGWIQTTSGVAPAPNRADGSQACEFPREQLTCDIYDAGGTQCVAAYSMVRSLYNRSNMQMRLYQVLRGLDGQERDIFGALANGYADSATQDAFCANTTCTITKIYDQSPFENDLSIEGPGGNGGQDSGAVANALPIMINGNKVYGLSVTPGVGYRNNATIGVARNVGNPANKTPEGMYMVTSGKNVNGACCFDFGNAETNNKDNGNGHMDALNFGTFCGFPPCSGSGPWVEADLENGQYMGGGSDPSNIFNISLGGGFVTAMLKNDSQTTFALKGGNAQSGTLIRMYEGSLPTQKPGYVPMQLEGGVVLGTGGDNSNADIGSFFEGAMTSGYPSDATEAAVQSDIVAAAYSGNSAPTNAEAPTYTGPSDPNGPGPQDGVAAPATEQSNDLIGSKPAMAFFNQRIYTAFQADNSSHDLFVASTTSGTPYPVATEYPNIQIGSAPAMAEFHHELYVAFQANDDSHVLFTTSSPNGSGFPTATGHPNIQIGSAPAMVEFRHQLVVAFQGNESGHHLFISASPDGQTFPTGTLIPNVQIGSAPAMAVFNGKLYVAFRANDSSNLVWITSSSDGIHFTSQAINGQHMGPNSSPALVVSNGVLYYIYGADDLANEMLVTASTDGSTWQGPKAYLNVEMGDTGPAATDTGAGFSVGFQSHDSRDVLFTSYKTTEALSYTGPSDPGGAGPQDDFSSPASGESSDVLGSKPAIATLNGRIYAAFQADNSSDNLFVTSSTPGTPFPVATGDPNVHIGSAPAMAGFNSKLYIAFQADNSSNNLFVTSSSDGSGFPTATGHPNIHIGSAPAMTVFNNNLYIAFQADDSDHHLFVTSSSDGTTWPAATYIPNVQIGSAPAMAVFNEKLYVAFRANDTSNAVFITSSSDGVNFTSQSLPGQFMGWNSSPALVSYGGRLYCIYRANDAANEMMVTASSDGSNWDGPKLYTGIQMSDEGPAAAVLNGTSSGPDYRAIAGFKSYNAANILFITTDLSAN